MPAGSISLSPIQSWREVLAYLCSRLSRCLGRSHPMISLLQANGIENPSQEAAPADHPAYWRTLASLYTKMKSSAWSARPAVGNLPCRESSPNSNHNQGGDNMEYRTLKSNSPFHGISRVWEIPISPVYGRKTINPCKKSHPRQSRFRRYLRRS
uniref:Uncharacterized protein n=1 Tax=Candidatus Kentrum sp. TC TaxID=2126339 RepID=A0A450Y8E8_9GAMM|nr:MAG: hypothetical protein BECKTC1821D_GA0114238_100267 [Candidatus Kentron sp. TC]